LEEGRLITDLLVALGFLMGAPGVDHAPAMPGEGASIVSTVVNEPSVLNGGAKQDGEATLRHFPYNSMQPDHFPYNAKKSDHFPYNLMGDRLLGR
jgi:hypothetical protein